MAGSQVGSATGSRSELSPRGEGENGDLSDIERMLMSEYDIPPGKVAVEPSSPQRQLRTPAERPKDVTSLDEPDFEVSAWMEARRNVSLDMLLQQQKGLKSDIAKLKSSTQTLVHDNYSRFIAAADIVRTMRSEFETMVGDTVMLREQVDGATQGSEAMNTRLHDHRASLSTLSELQELLEQLLTVRRLPNEVSELMHQGDVGSAVLLCSTSKQILQSHGHFALLRPVYEEMARCTEALKGKLTEMLEHRDGADARAIGATVQMLRSLGLPHHELQGSFLAGRSQHLRLALCECWSSVRHACSGLQSDPANVSVRRLWLHWDSMSGLAAELSDTMAALAHAVSVYMAVFCDPGPESLSNAGLSKIKDAGILALQAEALESHHTILRHACGVHSLLAASRAQPLSRWSSQDVSNCTHEDLQSAITMHADLGDFEVCEMLDCIETCRKGMEAIGPSMDMEKLQSQVAALAAGATRHALGCTLGAIEQSTVTAACVVVHLAPWSQSAGEREVTADWVERCVALLAGSCCALVHAFYAAIPHPALKSVGWSVNYLVQRQLQQLVVSVADRMCRLALGDAAGAARVEAQLGFDNPEDDGSNPLVAGTPRAADAGSGCLAAADVASALAAQDGSGGPMLQVLPEGIAAPESTPARWRSELSSADDLLGSAPATACLFLARILERIRETSIAQIMECIAEEESRVGTQLSSARSDVPPFVARAVQAQLSQAESKLLQSYVMRAADSVMATLRDAIEEETFTRMDTSSVGPPSAVLHSVLSSIAGTARDAAAVLPSGPPLPTALGGQGHVRNMSTSSDPYSRSDASSYQPGHGLLSKHKQITLSDVQGDVYSVVTVLSAHVLQFLSVRLKETELSTGALHQCQVDLRFLHGALNMPQVQPLCQEILSACENRCVGSGAPLLSHDEVERWVFRSSV